MTAAATHPQAVSAAQAIPAVEVVALGKAIDDRSILHDINLSIDPGEFVALVGANGAGKSTLLKMLATLTPPTSGVIRLFGRSTREGASVRARLGMIAHQSMLYRDLTARENLVLFARLHGVKDPKARAQLLLNAVGLAGRADDPVGAFSRGMVQRVSIARAIVHDPDLLLADEPYAGLDAPSTAAVDELLTMLHRRGRTIVLVNHDIAQSLRLAQRVIVLRGGKIVADKPTRATDAAQVLAEVRGS